MAFTIFNIVALVGLSISLIMAIVGIAAPVYTMNKNNMEISISLWAQKTTFGGTTTTTSVSDLDCKPTAQRLQASAAFGLIGLFLAVVTLALASLIASGKKILPEVIASSRNVLIMCAVLTVILIIPVAIEASLYTVKYENEPKCVAISIKDLGLDYAASMPCFIVSLALAPISGAIFFFFNRNGESYSSVGGSALV